MKGEGEGKVKMGTPGNTIPRQKTVTLDANINDPKLARLIEAHFNMSELKVLIHDLIYNPDNIEPHETFEIRVRALVAKCRRDNRLAELWELCKQKRPQADWESALEAPKSPPDGDSGKRSWRGVLLVAALVVIFVGVGGWMVGRNGRDVNTINTTPLPPQMVEVPVTRTVIEPVNLPVPANVKERFDFETAVSTAPLAGWGLDTCPTLNTSQCGWINADSMLSSAQFGFSGQNSLQVSATLVNADQIYSVEYCFDPALIDGISANIYIPTRETNQQALAATKIYLLARPQGDVNSQKQWPSSALALGEFAQPGWYQVSLDLSQVADENRRPYNTLLVDCVHIDLILPTAVQNEQANFLIDGVTLYRTTSTHDVEGNIPPRGLAAEETFVTAPTGEGIIFDFEDGALNADFWTVSDNKDTQPVTVSSKLAYDGAFSLQFTPDLEEREGNKGGNTFCLKLNGDEVGLQNRIVISRLFIPQDAPYNVGVQYHLTGQDFYPSWTNYDEDRFNIIKPGQWNTFAWYTADARSWVDGQDLELCLFLADRNAENDAKNTFRGTFYLDSVELIPYHFTHTSGALKSVNYFAFDNDDIQTALQNLTILERFTTSVNPRYIFENEGIQALQVVLDLPAAGEDGPTSDNSTGLVIDTKDEPVEAIFTMVLVPEGHDGSVMVTFEGIPTNGDEPVKETFSLEPGKWTPIFWPVRGNDFDNASYTAVDMEEVHVLITSAEAYAGPIYLDYLGVYRYFPKQ